MGGQHQRVDRSGLLRDTKGGRRQEEVERAGCKVIDTTLRVTGLMMMMMKMMMMMLYKATLRSPRKPDISFDVWAPGSTEDRTGRCRPVGDHRTGLVGFKSYRYRFDAWAVAFTSRCCINLH